MPLKRHLFIVGVSRSGTSLMRRILNRSSQIALLDETFYVGHLVRWIGVRYRLRRFGDLTVDDNVRRLVDYIYSDEFRRYSRFKHISWQWEWFRENIPPQTMLQRFLASDRSEEGLFDALMELFAESQQAEIGGEKTPAHLYYVPVLKRWYPEAAFIHMMRDPRAVFASEIRRRKKYPVTITYRLLSRVEPLLKLFLLAQVTISWKNGIRLYNRYKKLYADDYHLVVFEELVEEPERRIAELCRELAIEFQPVMLEQKVISYGQHQGQRGFDRTARERWRSQIPGWVDRWFRLWFARDMKRLGYTP